MIRRHYQPQAPLELLFTSQAAVINYCMSQQATALYSALILTHTHTKRHSSSHTYTHTLFLQGVSTEQFMQSCCLCLSNPILPLCNIQANTRKGNIPALLASCSKDYKHYTVCKLIVINIFVKPNLCPNIEFISTTLRTFCPCKLSNV